MTFQSKAVDARSIGQEQGVRDRRQSGAPDAIYDAEAREAPRRNLALSCSGPLKTIAALLADDMAQRTNAQMTSRRLS